MILATSLCAAVVAACGSSTTQGGGGCSGGEIRCTTCNGGAGFCSAACPAIACPVGADAGSSDGGGDASLAEASEGGEAGDGGAGVCPAAMPTSCTDCSSAIFCVSGACPETNCEVVDAGGSPSDAGACGTCGSDQLCVHPSCGGGTAPPCEALNDAGVCAAGWTYSASCQLLGSSSPGPGCQPPPCVAPPAFCADVPASCSGSLGCSCLPSNVCEVILPNDAITGGECFSVSDGQVSCASA